MNLDIAENKFPDTVLFHYYIDTLTLVSRHFADVAYGLWLVFAESKARGSLAVQSVIPHCIVWVL